MRVDPDDQYSEEFDEEEEMEYSDNDEEGQYEVRIDHYFDFLELTHQKKIFLITFYLIDRLGIQPGRRR